MNKILLGLGLVFAMGCGNKVDKIIGEMETYKDKMCACKDAECAEKVNTEKKDWEKSMKDKFSKDDFKDISDSQKKRGEEAETGFRDCRRKLRDSAEKKDAPAPSGDSAPAPETK